ncbi:MAG: TIGR00730 family Rossman fold protein [Anaerolineae bacterium]|nr:TIGR00730 family Rossman fold protein [Anaerolineae bacterium]
MNAICVYLGSSLGNDPRYAQAAEQMGALIAQRGLTLVYGGSNDGLMGLLADAALRQGGRVVGVLPQSLREKEIAHQGLSEQHFVNNMHERKALMMQFADAFIALPGGFGTYDEFFESLTWLQLGFHHKPCGLLNVAGFYTPFLAYLDHVVTAGFIKPAHRALIIEDDDPARLLDRVQAYQPQPSSKFKPSI